MLPDCKNHVNIQRSFFYPCRMNRCAKRRAAQRLDKLKSCSHVFLWEVCICTRELPLGTIFLLFSRSIPPKDSDFMYKPDSKQRIWIHDRTFHVWRWPRCLIRHLYMRRSSLSCILILNDCCISHKLCERYVCACWCLAEAFRCTHSYPQNLKQTKLPLSRGFWWMNGNICFLSADGVKQMWQDRKLSLNKGIAFSLQLRLNLRSGSTFPL